MVDCKDGVWKLKIAAPPIDGKANEEVIRFLSKLLDLPRRQIELVRGISSRTKAIHIHGKTVEEIETAFLAHLKGAQLK